MKVKRIKRATSGTLSEVGGRIFDTSSRNTISANRIEIDIIIFSLASAGSSNVRRFPLFANFLNKIAINIA